MQLLAQRSGLAAAGARARATPFSARGPSTASLATRSCAPAAGPRTDAGSLARGAVVAHAKTSALLFDCDGVIVETEELHRKAYNAAFEAFGCAIDGVPLVWTTEYYDVLQNTVGGGKPKMKYHFKNNGWPSTKFGPAPTSEEACNKLVDDLQDCKTDHYKVIVESAAEARPGVLALMDEGLARDDVFMCICSAATKEGFEKVVNSVVGPERLAKFDVILAGDDVTRKKPDPLIYNMARERLGNIPAERCVVIEDSLVGLRAAVGAGMKCIVTPTSSTSSADFCAEGAAAVLPALAGPAYQVSIDDIFKNLCDEEEGCRTLPDIDLKEGMCMIPWSVSPYGTTLGA
ncbi:hypothetical protein HYH03_013546 [Edaphochlamys debaryana]|uniref:Uncharacterized protein n=1 Tax=Edaphochlamys debaryana TaxID=47281 RepID=A0A835XQG6_9CHLO|nr:hypothetical protein HYH03_013546 [Edaphochlamys debaryana]|eukprot:KAG2487829.1 hypothetical protein HYH03_013546 [Edaphochlamys debaryana]